MENITRIQLLGPDNTGFLDVKENTALPLNFSVSDIRDVSSRSGMFSKTIVLVDSKNNNEKLNNYYDVNVVDGTYDVNKRQQVAVIQNGVVVVDNCYMRLVKVIRKQNVSTDIDNLVEYEVQITDEIGNFFKEIGNKEVKDISGWTLYNHTYGNTSVINSFSHTVTDGYKYILPWISNDRYFLKELLPGIYAKQIFDRIHTQAGFTYEWSGMTDDDVQFDKAILPYSGDNKKLTEDYIQKVLVKARNSNVQSSATVPTANSGNSSTGNTRLVNDVELQDVSNFYDPVTSVYDNTFAIGSPNSLVYRVNLEYSLVLDNQNAFSVNAVGGQQRFEVPLRVQDLVSSTTKASVKATLNLNPVYASSVSYYSNSSNKTGRILAGPYNWTPGEHEIATGMESIDLVMTGLTGVEQLVSEIRADFMGTVNSKWIHSVNGTLAVMKYKVVVNKVSIEIVPNSTNGILPGSTIRLQDFLPTKLKQSEFLKSVYQKYNLYVEPDKDNPNKLIYTSRDKFYDGGVIHDLTYKLDKSREQELYFLPDITSKTLVIKHKDDDSDAGLVAYRGETGETFGQVKYTFKNENIKGDAVNEESFSPTLNAVSNFNAVLPLLAADFKMNVRFLQDGGVYNCAPYMIEEGASIVSTLSVYPHISMLDKPYNPTFSNEYAVSDFYLYDVGLPTQNTLYNKHWRRTFAQINSGKMLKAYFWLDEDFIRGLRMSDKIKINNTLYYINAIVDYDANSKSATKMELLTIEDDALLPRLGKDVNDGVPMPDNPTQENGNPFVPIKPSLPNGFLPGVIGENISTRDRITTVSNGAFDPRGIYGTGNIVGKNFSGVVVGNNIATDGDGVYVGETTVKDSGIVTPVVDVGVVKNGDNSIDLSDPSGVKFNAPSVDFSNTNIVAQGGVIPGLDYLPLAGGTMTGEIEMSTAKIMTLGGGTPVNNLGIDASGNIVAGTTGGGAAVNTYTTTNNTPSNALSVIASGNSTELFKFTLTGNGTTSSYSAIFESTYRSMAFIGAIPLLIGKQSSTINTNNVNINVELVPVSTNNIRVMITGAAGETINWKIKYEKL